MNRLLNHMKLQASLADSNTRTCFGTVSSYDPDTYSCKVMIQPENVESAWLPIASPWVGDSWGMFCPPSIGDMVEVHYQEGDEDSGYVALRLYNDIDKPVNAPSGVFYLIHKSGSALKFNNDGSVDVIAHQDLRVVVGGKASITAQGTVTIDGGSGTPTGVVQGACKCAFTGQPHPMISSNVKGSL